MKQRDWVKELEAKKKKKKEKVVIEYNKDGWFKWYGTTSATSYEKVYYIDTGTGNYF
jgi:hypothetical protein